MAKRCRVKWRMLRVVNLFAGDAAKAGVAPERCGPFNLLYDGA